MSFYDVLGLQQNASLEDIRLAFKQRALEVHPDKGGTKEAFHRVYQAFETLVARQRREQYDAWLVSPKEPASQNRKDSFAEKRHKKQKRQPRRQTKDSDKTRSNPPHMPKPQPSSRSRLAKIQRLLGRLSRETRRQVICEHFSQKQRLLLEKWMSSMPGPAAGETRDRESVDPCAALPHEAVLKSDSRPRDEQFGVHLALPDLPARRYPIKAKPRGRSKVRGLGAEKYPSGLTAYTACVGIDGVVVTSRKCDLPTALDYLVILTSMKERIQLGDNLVSRMENALCLAAKEQGKELHELQLNLSLHFRHAYWIGRETLCTPRCHSFKALADHRQLLGPFFQRKRSRAWAHLDPQALREQWLQFQKMYLNICSSLGMQLTKVRQRLQRMYRVNADYRQALHRHLERKAMAREDPRRWRQKQPKITSRQRRAHVTQERRVTLLSRLLREWQCVIDKDDRLRSEQHRRKRKSTEDSRVNADPEALDISGFVSALAAAEAKVVSTSCGFLAYFQQALAAKTEKAFISSSLVALPGLRSRFPDEEIMILTFDAEILGSPAYSTALDGFAGPVVGLDKSMHLYEVISQDLAHLDFERAEIEMEQLAAEALDRFPGTKAMLLECTNLPPYKHVIRRHYAGEIHDCLTTLEGVHTGLVKERFLA
ncbi:LDJ2 [Symbiodinium sp. CCMP2456]|nr:LDJ2 [Symbiodinium sp. CCMP2456]